MCIECTLTSQEAIAIAVAVHEARQTRKPPDSKAIFYGHYDLWMYNAVLDDVLCDDCLNFEKTPRYWGDELISKFPFHKIINDNSILAKVHPNCRCTLDRITTWSEDDIKWFIATREPKT